MPDPLESAPPRKIIRNAAWLVAWDEAAQSHCYRRDVNVTIEGDTIAAIGPTGPAEHGDAIEIDGRGFAILPGFVDIHAHPSSEPMLKGLTDEVGSRQLYMSSLYEYLPLFEADAEGRRAATEVALCELMQSGITTLCDLSAAREDCSPPRARIGSTPWAPAGSACMRCRCFASAAGTRRTAMRCVMPGTRRPGGMGSTARSG